MSKLSVLVADATAEGNQVVKDTCNTWLVAINAGRVFLRLHRDFLRASRRQNKLVELGEPLCKFIKFLRTSTKLVPTGRLELLLFQALFFTPFETKTDSSDDPLEGCPSLRNIFSDLCAKGLPPVLIATATDGTKFSAEVWLGNLFFQGVAQKMALLEKVPLEVAGENLLTDLASLISDVELLRSDHSIPIGDLPADLSALNALVKGGAGLSIEVDVAGAKDALDAINTAPRLNILKAAFDTSSIGKALVSGCSVLLQTGAKDTAGNMKFTKAVHILNEGCWPMAIVAATSSENADASIANFEMVADVTIVDIFNESFDLFDEAMLLFSPGKHIELKAKIKDYVLHFLEHVLFIDECLCMYVRANMPESPPASSGDVFTAEEVSHSWQTRKRVESSNTPTAHRRIRQNTLPDQSHARA